MAISLGIYPIFRQTHTFISFRDYHDETSYRSLQYSAQIVISRVPRSRGERCAVVHIDTYCGTAYPLGNVYSLRTGKSPSLMGKSTISMVIFNSYVTNYQRVLIWICRLLFLCYGLSRGMPRCCELSAKPNRLGYGRVARVALLDKSG